MGASKYEPAFVARAREMCQQGATDADLSAEFGVSTWTIWNWSSRHSAFARALRAGKADADDRVERSLYHRAMGYTFGTEVIRVLHDGSIVRVPFVEHIPPDTTACIFWLKNRRPDLWRDVHKIDHTHTLARQMTDDELLRIAAGGLDGDNPPSVDPPKSN